MSREIDLPLKLNFAEPGDDQPSGLPSPVRSVRYPVFIGGVFDAGSIGSALKVLGEEGSTSDTSSQEIPLIIPNSEVDPEAEV